MSDARNLDAATRARRDAEKQHVERVAVERISAVFRGTGIVAANGTVMVDRDKDRVDVFVRVSMSFSECLREEL